MYQRAFSEALSARKLKSEREKSLPVKFNGKTVGTYTPDFVINGLIIVELKAKVFFTPQGQQQFWQYLRSTGFKLGFLINFGKSGGVEIVRRVY